jgi:hypothetical protein
MNHLLGKYLYCTQYSRPVDGIVVHVIKGGDQFTHDQMLKWAQIDKDHRCYKSVRGPAKVDRVVLDRENGGYWIAPLHIFVR